MDLDTVRGIYRWEVKDFLGSSSHRSSVFAIGGHCWSLSLWLRDGCLGFALRHMSRGSVQVAYSLTAACDIPGGDNTFVDPDERVE
jgi:hypothetical protein